MAAPSQIPRASRPAAGSQDVLPFWTWCTSVDQGAGKMVVPFLGNSWEKHHRSSPNGVTVVGVAGEPLGNKTCKRRASCIQESREMQSQQLSCRIGSKCFSFALSKSWLWLVWLRVAVFLARLDKLFGLACQLFACSFQNRLGQRCRHGTPLPTGNSSNCTADRGKSVSQVDSQCMSCSERKHRRRMSYTRHFIGSPEDKTNLYFWDTQFIYGIATEQGVAKCSGSTTDHCFVIYFLLRFSSTRGPIHATVSVFHHGLGL